MDSRPGLRTTSPSSGTRTGLSNTRTLPPDPLLESAGRTWWAFGIRQPDRDYPVPIVETESFLNLEASTACRGCKGKGIVLDEKRTRFHGVPVYKICGRCNGNRFSRLPTTLARRHVQKLVPDLTDYQWYKGYADVIGKLVTKCWQEEAYAEAQLRKVTR